MLITKKFGAILIVAASLLLLASCGGGNREIAAVPAESSPPEPMIPFRSVFEPTFKLEQRNIRVGTAFAAEIGEAKVPVIISAIHLLGPNGGLDKNIPSRKIPDVLKSVTLSDAFDSEPCGIVTKALAIPGARPSSIKKDVMAFLPDGDADIAPLKISDTIPLPGDTVWLAAPVITGAPPGQKLHRATIVKATASKLVYRYDINSLNLQGSSGAPIIDRNGEVVGINISKDEKDGELFGLANPSASFTEMIRKALAES